MDKRLFLYTLAKTEHTRAFLPEEMALVDAVVTCGGEQMECFPCLSHLFDKFVVVGVGTLKQHEAWTNCLERVAVANYLGAPLYLRVVRRRGDTKRELDEVDFDMSYVYMRSVMVAEEFVGRYKTACRWSVPVVVLHKESGDLRQAFVNMGAFGRYVGDELVVAWDKMHRKLEWRFFGNIDKYARDVF